MCGLVACFDGFGNYVLNSYKVRILPVPKVYPVKGTCFARKRACFGVIFYVRFPYRWFCRYHVFRDFWWISKAFQLYIECLEPETILKQHMPPLSDNIGLNLICLPCLLGDQAAFSSAWLNLGSGWWWIIKQKYHRSNGVARS